MIEKRIPANHNKPYNLNTTRIIIESQVGYYMRFLVLIILAFCCTAVFIPAMRADGEDFDLIGGDAGYFDLTSDPSGASVTVDGTPNGATPVRVEIYSTGSPTHTISMTMAGYKPWSVTRNSPAAGQIISINADLDPQPVTPPTTSPTQVGGGAGYFEINSDPAGAQVTMDGSNKGYTPVTVKVSPSGNPQHTFVLTKPGFNRWTQDYYGNPRDGDTVQIYADLVPTPVTPTPTIPTPTQIGGDTGYYRITSSPSGATVTFDGKNIGLTPAIANVYVTANPRHTVTVTMPGYEDWGNTYNQNPFSGEYIEVNAVLVPLQQTGSITVSSSPSGAYARLDGGDTQVTPCSFTGVSAGYHSVEITLTGYQPYQTSVRVNANQVSNVYSSLTPVRNYGSLRITSSPAGAELDIDGYYRGYTPVTVGALAAGSHTARLRLAGYQEWRATVNVPSGGTSTYSPTLVPVSSPTTGFMTVTSSPSGAMILLDGNYQGRTMDNNPFDIIDISPGTHTVTLKLTGYQDYSTSIRITAGQTVPVSAVLTPSGKPAGTATIIATSDPAGADVLVDNSYRGITPVTMTDITPGTHTVALKMNGYNPYSTQVQVTAGQSFQVNAGLSPVPTTAEPTRAPGFIPFTCIAALGLASLALAVRRH